MLFLFVLFAGAYARCTSDEDCSLLGTCEQDGSCRCSAGWTGADCGVLKLSPAEKGTGYNLTGANPPISSWGANIFEADDGAWHMYAAEFEEHCDVSKWSPNSAVIHAVSKNGAEGPYTRVQEVIPPFSHNPKVVQAPDGTWLMYTIGIPMKRGDLANCTKDRQKTLSSPTPGRTPQNLESNITLFTAPALVGPWTRYGVILGPDWMGTWDEDTSNPSPVILPNGTVLLMYRGCQVHGGGCWKEFIGIASASHWRGP